MKTFREFLGEAYLIERGQPTFSSRAELEKHYKGVPSGMVANNARTAENPKWRLVTAANRKAQSQRRATNLRPITHQELEDHARRNLYPSPAKTARRALKIERERKRTQRKEAQTQTQKTGIEHNIGHIVPQPDKRREAIRSRYQAIHPGDASDNREIEGGKENREKNSKNTRTTLTRSAVIKRALDRAR